MKILVCGGAGFVGSAICMYFRVKYPHYKITAFDNLRRRGSELNISKLAQEGISFIHGDIRNIEDLESVASFDVMIDASAEPSVLAGLDSNPNYVIQNNLIGTINCLQICLNHKAKFILMSTSRVYPIDKIENAEFVELDTRFSFSKNQKEAGISKEGISEKLDIWGPRSFYGATKLSSELFVLEYSAFYGIQSAITRFGVIAGPGQLGKTDQGVVTLWVAKHYFQKSLSYIGYGGEGKQVRDILHIDDATKLIDLQVHQTDLFEQKVYNAGGGSGNSLSLQEMTKLCQEITGHTIPIDQIAQTRPADLRIYITDNAMITKDTGWRPKKNTVEILTDIYTWIKTNEASLKPILS